MQHITKIVLGLVFGAVGAVILLSLNLVSDYLNYGAWGLLGIGGILVITGAQQYLTAGEGGADATEIYKSDTIARLVLQSTILTAIADGPLDDEEIAMIATACESVTHEPLNKESIRRLEKLVGGRNEEILHEIHSEGRLLNPDARRAIIDGCILVLKADEKVDERQTAVVMAIALHLDYTEGDAQAMIADAMGEAEQA